MVGLNIMKNLRPCLVTEVRRKGRGISEADIHQRRALFHDVVTINQVIPPSLMRGGHNGGQASDVYALVEYENGTTAMVDWTRVLFLDSREQFDGYIWPTDEEIEE